MARQCQIYRPHLTFSRRRLRTLTWWSFPRQYRVLDDDLLLCFPGPTGLPFGIIPFFALHVLEAPISYGINWVTTYWKHTMSYLDFHRRYLVVITDSKSRVRGWGQSPLDSLEWSEFIADITRSLELWDSTTAKIQWNQARRNHRERKCFRVGAEYSRVHEASKRRCKHDPRWRSRRVGASHPQEHVRGTGYTIAGQMDSRIQNSSYQGRLYFLSILYYHV